METSQSLLADPKDVDKIMADELNALSFHDREALSEEVHGVRSLAPEESPKMIKKALHDLQFEIEARLSNVLASLPSLSNSHGPQTSENHPNSNGTRTNSHLSRREYLSELFAASKVLSSSSSHFSQDAKYPDTVHSNSSPDQATSIPNSFGQQPAVFQNSEGSNINKMHVNNYRDNHINGMKYSRYSYALSDGFRLKFLRAELFDVKKAAARYLTAIDFLVDYFGLVALQRPLYLKDLDKDEQKLLREGRCQLLPSRDRFGRRIIVFIGAMGNGYSHRNRFKVVMYTVFQAASDDVTTQRLGLVAVFSSVEDSTVGFFQFAYHQTECLKFFEAVPLRYSAFHCILPEGLELLKGLILNMVGKRTRLITRVHTVSGITETSYMLRCFGIPTEDYPVTSSGSVKNRKHIKWIKFRMALEEAHERGAELSSYNQLPPAVQNQKPQTSSQSVPPFLGIECPQIYSVIFRNGGSAYDRPGNVKFREILAKMELEREQHKTMAEKTAYLDTIMSHMFSSGLSFLLYDDQNDWYVELPDGPILRKKVFQALRDQSARRKRLENGAGGEQQSRRQRQRSIGGRTAASTNHQVNESSTNIFMGLDNVKRRKMEDMMKRWI